MSHHLRTLFQTGLVGDLTDAELLQRYRENTPAAAEAAFTILVDRHFSMVFGVCRSFLNDPNDAEDAAQATFLILAIRAGSIRSTRSVASWLHGVARRVAAKSRASAALRRLHERRFAEMSAARGASTMEDLPEIYEEIDRLPEIFRAPIVLCDLEGCSYDQAARQLGLPLGTVQSRLARGRARLRERLTRRGIGSAGWGLVIPAARHAAVPAALALGRLANREVVSGIVSAGAIARARTFARGELMRRLIPVMFGLATLGFIAWGVAVPAQQNEAVRPEVRKAAVPDDRSGVQMRTVFARVVDARERPVSRATVHALGLRTDRIVTADANGRVQVPLDLALYPGELLLVVAPNDEEIGWVRCSGGPGSPIGTTEAPLTITVLPRRRTVHGIVVDPDGKPVAGARIEARQIGNDTNGYANCPTPETPERLWPFVTVTDREGRFSMRLPEETQALMAARHPRFASPWIVCGPASQAIAPVTLVAGGIIAGTVRDGATGQPVVGALIGAQALEHRTPLLVTGWGPGLSDKQGRFEIVSVGPGVYNLLFLGIRGNDRATAQAVEGLRVSAGRTATADLVVSSGRLLAGTVVDHEQKPLAGVELGYYGSARPSSGGAILRVRTDSAGHFALRVPPGRAYFYLARESGPPVDRRMRTFEVPDDRDPDPVRIMAQDPSLAVNRPDSLIPTVNADFVVKRRGPTNGAGVNGERTLEGHVRDRNANPMPGLRIVLYQPGKLVAAVSDCDGRFMMAGLPVGDVELYVDRELEFVTHPVRIDAECLEVEFILDASSGAVGGR